MDAASPVGRDGRGFPLLVVAAALCQDDKVLISQRPAGKPHAGFWEYPGGKVEEGESPGGALRRELEEELGVVVRDPQPVSFTHDAHIVLLLFACSAWTGNPEGKEGQTLKWVTLAQLEQLEMLALDQALIRPLRASVMRS